MSSSLVPPTIWYADGVLTLSSRRLRSPSFIPSLSFKSNRAIESASGGSFEPGQEVVSSLDKRSHALFPMQADSVDPEADPFGEPPIFDRFKGRVDFNAIAT